MQMPCGRRSRPSARSACRSRLDDLVERDSMRRSSTHVMFTISPLPAPIIIGAASIEEKAVLAGRPGTSDPSGATPSPRRGFEVPAAAPQPLQALLTSRSSGRARRDPGEQRLDLRVVGVVAVNGDAGPAARGDLGRRRVERARSVQRAARRGRSGRDVDGPAVRAEASAMPLPPLRLAPVTRATRSFRRGLGIGIHVIRRVVDRATGAAPRGSGAPSAGDLRHAGGGVCRYF